MQMKKSVGGCKDKQKTNAASLHSQETLFCWLIVSNCNLHPYEPQPMPERHFHKIENRKKLSDIVYSNKADGVTQISLLYALLDVFCIKREREKRGLNQFHIQTCFLLSSSFFFPRAELSSKNVFSSNLDLKCLRDP